MNNLKIAWRNVLRTKLFTAFNIFGLALGFAGFILAYLYINRETSYDKWNPNYEHIYLVGLTYQGSNTDLTPPALANALKSKLPELVEVGRVSYFPWELPFISDEGYAYVKDWKAADLSIAKMFGVEAYHSLLSDTSRSEVNLLSPETFQHVFPDQDEWTFQSEAVKMDPLGMFTYNIHGAAKPRGLSNFTYDAIFFLPVLPEREGDPMPYQTFLQVKSGTDTKLLEKKIDAIYKQEIAKQHYSATAAFAEGDIYLDPLKNLHLKPKHGSNSGYITVWALGLLSGVILLLAGINFANLMIAQAGKRAKEIGIKKLFGVSRRRLALQFMGEVLVHCLVAAILAGGLIYLFQHVLEKWQGYDLVNSVSVTSLIWELLLATLLTTLVSGGYPALILSGYRPAHILKGNFQTNHRTVWFRHALLTFQFVIAMVFISGALILNKQLDYMRHGDKGFDPAEVVYIKNMKLLNKPEDFRPFRDRMKAYPGIEYTTVATSVPGGIDPTRKEFQFRDKMWQVDHIGVDFDYVETMGMEVLQGHSLIEAYAADSVKGALINETLAKSLGVEQAVGQTIRGCDTDFEIVGVVKDSKTQGFERAVQPMVYSIHNPCGQYKTEILVRVKPGTMQQTLVALEKDWKSINSSAGDYFSYDFIDQKYAALYAQQEQLESAFSTFTVLSIAIAMMGLFSMSAYSIRIRQREMSIRKVLGASVGQLFIHLNRSFFRTFLLANLIALPVAYFLVGLWLDTFAYRIDIQWWMFALAGTVALLIAVLTVAYQSLRAARANPVDSLREE